jgi:hypothetical protein
MLIKTTPMSYFPHSITLAKQQKTQWNLDLTIWNQHTVLLIKLHALITLFIWIKI